MTPCPDPLQWARFRDEELEEAERAALEAHVQVCDACAEALTRLIEAAGADLVPGLRNLHAEPGSGRGSLASLGAYPSTRPLPEGVAEILFPDPPSARGPLGRLDSYHIVQLLGRGSYGLVFQAFDENLGCLVALKILRPEWAADPQARRRFADDARNAAAVRHDNVVVIHHLGETPSFALPFFVMEYIPGETLADRVRREKFLPPRECAELLRQIALGVEAIHQKGVIHRDLKPSNILIDSRSGRPRVTDFGLALDLDPERARMTQSGTILGTPLYMSPEQILTSGQVSPVSDIYSLGAILYEVLTGYPPFRGTTTAILQKVVHEEPAPPRSLDDRVPRDLNTICLKCLEKDPRRRYSTAKELADRLKMFLEGQPIPDRPIPRGERLWRWSRRNPAVAGLLGSVAFLLVLIAVVATTLAGLAIQGQKRAEEAEEERRKLWEVFLGQTQAAFSRNQAGQRFESLAVMTRFAHNRPSLELRNVAIGYMTLTDFRLLPDLSWKSPARLTSATINAQSTVYAYADSKGVVQVHRLSDHGLLDVWDDSADPAYVLALSPNGRFLAAKVHPEVQSAPGQVRLRVRDVVEKQTILDVPYGICHVALAWDSKSTTLAVGRLDDAVYLWEMSRVPKERRLIPLPQPCCVAFRPDDTSLAVGSGSNGEVCLVRVADGTSLARLASPSAPWSLAWHPDGQHLAGGGGADGDNQFPVFLWNPRIPEIPQDSKVQQPRVVLPGHSAEITSLAFSHRGDLLASAGYDGTRVWDAWTGRLRVQVPATGAMRFRLDDGSLVYAHQAGVDSWEMLSGRECQALHGHRGYKGPWGLAYGPEGRLLVSAGNDGVRLWNPDLVREVHPLLEGDRMESVFFDPHRGNLGTCGNSGVHLRSLTWDAQGTVPRLGRARCLIPMPCNKACTDALGKRLVVTDRESGLHLYDLEQMVPLPPLEDFGPADVISLSPDGHWLALGQCEESGLRIIDLEKEQCVAEFPGCGRYVTFSPDSRHVIASTKEGYQSFYLREEAWTTGPPWPIGPGTMAAFDPTGRIVALAINQRAVRLVEASTGRELASLPSPPDPPMISWVAFHPQGTQLAVATEAHAIYLWDLRLIRKNLAAMNLDWE